MSQELQNHKSKCRLCFKNIKGSRKSSKITENDQQKFLNLTNFELKSSERYSNIICEACSKSLNDSSDFQLKMIDNQLRLYALDEANHKLIVKAEPIELETIQLQEIMFADLLPKTEVFDDSCVKEQSPKCEDFDEVASPTSPDNNRTATPPNAVEDVCQEDSGKKEDPSTIQQRKRVRTKYEPEQLFNAVEAVALGELSAYAASKQFGVPRRAVSKRFRADYDLLTDQEDLQVKLFVNRRTEAGIPSTDDDIEKFILLQVLGKRRGKDRVKIKSLSSTWVSMFRKRHSDMNVLDNLDTIELICDICGFAIQEKKKMKIHMDLHARTELLQKPPRKKFQHRPYTSEVFETALKSIAGGMSIRKASLLFGIPSSTISQHCRKVAKDKSGLPREIFKCSFCDKAFFKKSGRYTHEVDFHLTPVGEFPCELCERVYPSQIKLKRHKYTAHEKQFYNCIECSESFDDANKLRVHRISHKEEVACHVCGRMVKEGRKMTVHMQSHAPSDTFKCSFEGCTKSFHNKSSFDYHKNTHVKQNIKCPKCSATFPNATRLKRHDERSHGEARFFCMMEGCSYKNTRKEYLKLHLRNHKDIDVFMRDELIASLHHLKALK